MKTDPTIPLLAAVGVAIAAWFAENIFIHALGYTGFGGAGWITAIAVPVGAALWAWHQTESVLRSRLLAHGGTPIARAASSAAAPCGIPRRACENCLAEIRPDASVCSKCGTDTEPWHLNDGRWWVERPDGWYSLEPSLNRWARYEAEAAPANVACATASSREELPGESLTDTGAESGCRNHACDAFGLPTSLEVCDVCGSPTGVDTARRNAAPPVFVGSSQTAVGSGSDAQPESTRQYAPPRDPTPPGSVSGRKQEDALVRRCTECGNELEPNDRFCGRCGASRELAAVQRAASAGRPA